MAGVVDEEEVVLARRYRVDLAGVVRRRDLVVFAGENDPLYDVRSMSDRFEDSLARRETVMLLLILFSAVALLLATIGLYGVLSFTVASHTREIGIRAALGAQRSDLFRLVQRAAGAVTLMGVALGTAGALLASRVLGGLIYGVQPVDPPSYLGAVGLIVAVSLLASWLPARRAASVDPAVVLASE